MDDLRYSAKINIAQYLAKEYSISVKDKRPLADIVKEKIQKGLVKKRQGRYIFIG